MLDASGQRRPGTVFASRGQGLKSPQYLHPLACCPDVAVTHIHAGQQLCSGRCRVRRYPAVYYCRWLAVPNTCRTQGRVSRSTGRAGAALWRSAFADYGHGRCGGQAEHTQHEDHRPWCPAGRSRAHRQGPACRSVGPADGSAATWPRRRSSCWPATETGTARMAATGRAGVGSPGRPDPAGRRWSADAHRL
jgi:hypothetical protein